MSNGIEIRQTLVKDLKGSTFICGLPGVGLVGNIVANFLVNNLKLEQIGIIDGFAFPSISVVKDGIPNHPMRDYTPENKYAMMVNVIKLLSVLVILFLLQQSQKFGKQYL